MSQTGYSKVQIYSSSTATNTPSASNLTNDTNGSELGINITDGKLFYKDNSGTVQVMATKGTGPIGGSNTQVQYNSSGALAGSANMTFDGTTLTANTLSVSTSTTTPIVQSSGSLLLKTNGTTTALTINTSQQATFANTINVPNTFGFKNRIINGAMVIDQRNNGASVAVTGNTGQMSVDRFLLTVFGSGTGRFTTQQSTTVPVGFYNSLSATVTTADSSPSSAYAYSIAQIIEGLNVLDLGWGTSNASTVTLSFWVRSSVTGTFPIVITNGNLDRTYGATYTINSANTFQYITITIPGDTTGTWAKNNTAGINIQFGLGGGSSRTVSTGWQANAGAITQTNVTGCTQLIATNGATFYITGVQFEVGTQATSFDYRPYGTELALCQRYLPAFASAGATQSQISMGQCLTSTTAGCIVPFPVSVRTPPTGISVSGTFNMTQSNGTSTSASLAFSQSSTLCCQIIVTGSGLSAGNATILAASGGGNGLLLFTGCEL